MIKTSNYKFLLAFLSFLLLSQLFSPSSAHADFKPCGFNDLGGVTGNLPYMTNPVLLSVKASQYNANTPTSLLLTWLDPQQCLPSGNSTASIYNDTTTNVITLTATNLNLGNSKSTTTIENWLPEPGQNSLHFNFTYYFNSYSSCPQGGTPTPLCPVLGKVESAVQPNVIPLGTFIDQVALAKQATEKAAAEKAVQEQAALAKIIADKKANDKALADKKAAQDLAAKTLNDDKFYAGQIAANAPLKTSISLAWVSNKLLASWNKNLCKNGTAKVALYSDNTYSKMLTSNNAASGLGKLSLKVSKAKSYFVKLNLTGCANNHNYSNII